MIEQADSLAGEAITVNSHNLLFAGTSITGGNATGDRLCDRNKIRRLGISRKPQQKLLEAQGTLENQIRKITKILGDYCAYFWVLLAFLYFNICHWFFVKCCFNILQSVLLWPNIPEGLMPTVSLSLAMSVQRMAK